MTRLVPAFALALLALSGCATGGRAYMDSALANRSEPASVWNRPQEVGFDWSEEITGEASQQCVLFFICWGADDGGALEGVGAVLGALTGRSQAVGDPLVRAAAATAVKNNGKANGMFVESHETNKVDFFLYRSRTATVKGKAITTKPLGEVSVDRADKHRNLSALGGSLVNVTP